MSNADKIVAALCFGAAALAYLFFFVFLPAQQKAQLAQQLLDEVGGVDLQPTNQRVDDPLGKTLGVKENG